MESINITQKILNENEIIILIESTKSEQLKEAIKLAYYEGIKLSDILEKINIPRRTLQGKLSRLGEEVFEITVNFEQLRQSSMIRLINQGYTPEYVTKFMGYSRKDYFRYKRRLAGYLNPKLRYKILMRDKCKCKICGSSKQLEVDHIIPVSKGGKTIKNNLRTLCRECNLGKGEQII